MATKVILETDIKLNVKNTAIMMGISNPTFLKWNIKSVEKKGSQVFYDLKTVIAYRSNREKKTSSKSVNLKDKILEVQLEKKKLEVDRLKGESVSKEIYEYDIDALFTIIKTQVLALASKLTPLLQDVKTRERHKIITEECRGLLQQAADNIRAAQETQRKSVGN